MTEITDTYIAERLIEGAKVKPLAIELGITEWRCRKVKQQLLDMGRIDRTNDRKSHRKTTSIENLGESIDITLRSVAKQLGKSKRPKIAKKKGASVAMVTLSDCHFNELCSEESNTYDLDVASQRLALLASRVRTYAKANGCDTVIVSLVGDLINSDRRMDELLSAATSRARAVVIATHMISQFILDLRQDFNINVASVSGNESRIGKDLCWSDLAASDNFDMMIHYNLNMLFKDDKGIKMLEPDTQVKILEVGPHTIALTHGTTLNAGDQKSVQAFMGKYSQESGVKLNHVFCGHIHATLISDYVSRNSSLSGGNGYSGKALHFASKAAQNCTILHMSGAMEGIKIDLSVTDGVEGYCQLEQSKSWGIKSAQKRVFTIDKI